MEKKKYSRFGYSRDLKVIAFQLLSFFLFLFAIVFGILLYHFTKLSMIYFVLVYIGIPFMFFKYPQKVEKVTGFTYFLLIISTLGAFPYYGNAKLINIVWVSVAIFGYVVKRKHNKLLKEYYENK